jgi:hypothetical protein
MDRSMMFVTSLPCPHGSNGNERREHRSSRAALLAEDRADAQGSVWLTKTEKNGFVAIGTSPGCGTFVPGTTSVSSP